MSEDIFTSRIYMAPDVFYRVAPNGSVILYQTSMQKIYLMDKAVIPVLDTYASSYPKEEETDKYGDIINQLADLGILVREKALAEKKDALEGIVKMSIYNKTSSLYAVQFELTYRCNERCRHCYCPRDCDVANELSTAEIMRILDELKRMNVVEVTFTGGDLFVRKDAFDILKYAYGSGFVIDIFTNGTLLSDSDLLRLKMIYPRSVHFSIYNYKPEKHDAFTRLDGSFEKTVGAMKKCRLLGIPVNMKVSLVEDNADDVEGILELAESLGVTVQVSMQITPKNDGSMDPTALRLNNSEKYAEIMKRVEKHILVSCANGGEVTDVEKAENGPVCGAGAFSLSINPYGEVYPCNSLLISCGNVREKSIEDIWNNSETLKRVRAYRMDRIKGCSGCENKKYCDFCPGSAMQETGDPLTKYSEACALAQAKRIKFMKGETK